MSDPLRPYGLQHTRLPCPSPTLGIYSNSCPLRWWCHPTISSSVIPFSCVQILPSITVFSKEWVLHIMWPVQFSQFSHSAVSSSLRPHGLQHTRSPCHHQLFEPIQTHVHCVSDATQPSQPLLFPSPPTFSLSQHQGLCKCVSSSHQVAKVLEFQLQHQSFQWIFRTDFLYDGLVGSPYCPRDSQHSPPTPWFKSFHSSVLSFLYSPTLTSIHDYWENHSFD